MPDRPAASHRRPTGLTWFPYGSCYYPEHCPEAFWERDAERMAAAGFNLARMAEFAWTRMEPEPGRFDFSLFDRAIETLAGRGVKSMLCTPTAAPPRWFTAAHPDSLRVDGSGRALSHGSRQHVSAAHPAYREASRRITSAMAEHFAENPHVVGWQTDNEFHCHFHDDHSEAARVGFVAWCKDKFDGDIAALNHAWGTAFWSQEYDHFDQLLTPKPNAPTHVNPAHRLDHLAFLSDATAAFQRDQTEILRAANPRWWITHNGVFADLDYRGSFAEDLDFLGFDSYPMFWNDPAERPALDAARLDRIRGWTGNFVVPEQQSGAGGQSGTTGEGSYMLDAPAPGEMRQMALRSIARGCDGLLFFRWRTARFGAEQHWLGLLDADDRPSRRYGEAAGLGEELARLAPAIRGSHVRVDAATAGADFTLNAGFGSCALGLDEPETAAANVNRVLFDRGIASGSVFPADDLSGVKLYVLPHTTLFDPAWVEPLEAWVRGGGHLVVGAMTGNRDRQNNLVTSPPPGVLAGLAGVTVKDSRRINEAGVRPLLLRRDGEDDVRAEQWAEVLDPAEGTEVLARWAPVPEGAADDGFAGRPAATVRGVGAGRVVYLGCWLTPTTAEALLPPLLAAAGVEPILPGLPAGVEAVQRVGPQGVVTFLLNPTQRAIDLPDLGDRRDLLRGEPAARSLPAFGVVALAEPAG